MEEIGDAIIVLGSITLFICFGWAMGSSITEREMKQQIIDEHRAEWVVDQKGITSFRWK